MKKYIPIIIIVSLFVACLWSIFSLADTIVLKDNSQLKGVILEDYADRVHIATFDGEQQVMKPHIKKIAYDLEEQNLTSRADSFADKGQYEKAYYYYQKALEVNPDYKKAKDGLNYVTFYLSETDARIKSNTIQQMNELKIGKQTGPTPKRKTLDKEKKLKKELGIILKNAEKSFEIEDVVYDSSADKVGIKKGDILLATWGRNVSYMEPDEVLSRLLDTSVLHIQLTVLRTIKIHLQEASGGYLNVLGAELGFSELQGLIIKKVIEDSSAGKAGLEVGDIITRIGGKSTLHMTLGEIKKLIMQNRGKPISLTFKRDINIWKIS